MFEDINIYKTKGICSVMSDENVSVRSCSGLLIRVTDDERFKCDCFNLKQSLDSEGFVNGNHYVLDKQEVVDGETFPVLIVDRINRYGLLESTSTGVEMIYRFFRINRERILGVT